MHPLQCFLCSLKIVPLKGINELSVQNLKKKENSPVYESLILKSVGPYFTYQNLMLSTMRNCRNLEKQEAFIQSILK